MLQCACSAIVYINYTKKMNYRWEQKLFNLLVYSFMTSVYAILKLVRLLIVHIRLEHLSYVHIRYALVNSSYVQNI